MKVLFVKSEDDARDKISFALESRLGATFDFAGDFAKAASLLESPKAAYDLIIIDTPIPSTLNGLEKGLSSVPLILCGGTGKDLPQGWNLLGIADRKDLLSNICRLAEKVQSSESQAQYCKIRARILLSVCPLKGDIFIRLSDQKFVKLFHEGDTFEKTDWVKYTEQKGVEYLYIQREQCEQFIEKYRRDLETHLREGNAVSVDTAATVSDSVHETVQEMARVMGFTKDVQLLAKTQINIAVKALKKNPDLADLLQRLETSKAKYVSSHSTLTGYLSSAIASQMEWGSDATMFKLNLAAFLHDIDLFDDALCACRTLKDAEKGGFSADALKAFKEHPTRNAAAARQFSDVPPDVDAIIIQHHEWPDGSGFPRGIGSTHISPLASVFIVAHEMADQILKKADKFSMKDFLLNYSDVFARGNFRKVLDAAQLIRLTPKR